MGRHESLPTTNKLSSKLKIAVEVMPFAWKIQKEDICGLESPSEIEMMLLILESFSKIKPVEIKCKNMLS